MSLLDAGEIGAATIEEVAHAVAVALSLHPSDSEAFWADMWAEYLGTLNEELLAYVDSHATVSTSLRTADGPRRVGPAD